MQTYQCSAKLADGNRCWRRVSAESEPAYCYQHDPAKKGRERRAAALKDAVVEATMRAYHAGWQGVDFGAMDAACGALANAEKE